MLRDAIAELPHTKDPARDLIQAALTVFRPMAVEHPSLFRIAFLRAAPDVELGPDVGYAARAGYELLTERVQRLADADLLGGRDVQAATREFNAMCFGMAVTELLNPAQLGPDPQRAWCAAFQTLINGFRAPALLRRGQPAQQTPVWEVVARAGLSTRVLHDVYVHCISGQDDTVSQPLDADTGVCRGLW
jgi:hypothetical protein